MSWVDHIEGTLPADDLRRAFVEGARWWLYISKGNQMPSDDLKLVEAAAEARYPGGKPPPPDNEYCALIPIFIATVAGDTPDIRTAIMDNPPYIQTDSYEIIKEDSHE